MFRPELLSPEGYRLDGRLPYEIRPLNATVSMTRANPIIDISSNSSSSETKFLNLNLSNVTVNSNLNSNSTIKPAGFSTIKAGGTIVECRIFGPYEGSNNGSGSTSLALGGRRRGGAFSGGGGGNSNTASILETVINSGKSSNIMAISNGIMNNSDINKSDNTTVSTTELPCQTIENCPLNFEDSLNVDITVSRASNGGSSASNLSRSVLTDWSQQVKKAFGRLIRLDQMNQCSNSSNIDNSNNMTLDILLNIVSQDGSVLPHLLNATTLALNDAGVPMLDLLSSCSVGYITEAPRCYLPKDSVKRRRFTNEGMAGSVYVNEVSNNSHNIKDPIALDLLDDEEDGSLSKVTLASTSANNGKTVVFLETSSSGFRIQSAEEFSRLVDIGLEGCKTIRSEMREKLLESMTECFMRRKSVIGKMMVEGKKSDDIKDSSHSRNLKAV